MDLVRLKDSSDLFLVVLTQCSTMILLFTTVFCPCQKCLALQSMAFRVRHLNRY